MDIRQLNALLSVADHGTFSAAADALETVQSNVSGHIARLEKELGAQLIDRSAGRLTEEGEAVVRRARRIVAELDAARADVAAIRDEVIGDVRIGMIGTTARWLVPDVLEQMAARYPQARLSISEGTTRTLEPPLLAGVLDLAVILLPATTPDIAAEPIFEEDMLLVVPSTHELAGAGTVNISALHRMPLLLPPAGTTARVEIESAARGAGAQLIAKAEIDGVRLSASLTFDGHGPAILPATALPANLDAAWTTVQVAGLPRRSVGLARLRRTYPSAPARALRQVMLEVLSSTIGLHPGVHPSGR